VRTFLAEVLAMNDASRRAVLLGGLALWVAPPLRAAAAGLDTGRVYRNRVTGESARLLEATAEAVRYEWGLAPGGAIALEHAHPRQQEIFEILEGELNVQVDGGWRRHRAGEVVAVPRGAAHKTCNDTDRHARALVSLAPGLDALPALQIFWGMCDEGLLDRWGRPEALTIAALTSHLECCPTPVGLPEGIYPLSGLTLRALQSRGEVRDLYRRYTGGELPG
jgi:quercetin dioxygenase-like cupin family protein